ncbi:MAG: sigma-54-dependent Fis family transcriptional regulator [Calditrichaeota bacterium]|nr:sigma-54-dependent Fis family transcriptional regulator [Calditrichota bacterium]
MILLIDDDEAVLASIRILLKQSGYETELASDPEQARVILQQNLPQLVLMDMNFSLKTSGEEGLAFLKEIKTDFPQIPVILITAWGSIDLAVKGMQTGASDFVTKPWNNAALLNSIKTALSLSGTNTSKVSRKQLDNDYVIDHIVGEDPDFLKALETACRVSATDAPVLITGESGTGKELIAEAIHLNSERKNGPFIKVNLGGISSALFESEMFGHKKGAFTDAKADRVGRFEMADRGTIFLDEIGDLDLNSQVKLLRVLQDRSFEVLGSSHTKAVDFRVVCATNRNLAEMVSRAEFREDLFYRINLITVRLPALRERKKDIPLFIRFYLDNLKRIYRRTELSIDQKSVNYLTDLHWSGNIRELKNLVERTVLISNKDHLTVDDFNHTVIPEKRKESGQLPAVGTMTLDEIELSMIEKALDFHDQNISKVAKSLGLSRAALYRRLEKYGIRL